MLNRIIELALSNRLLVLVLSALLLVAGGISLTRLPMDAFPDTTPVQVQVNTVASSLSPLEIEQQITLPVELAISGLPGLKLVRSISKFGLSQVVVIFEDGTDIYFARQLILERLQSLELPEGLARPTLGPMATGLGEIFHYLVEGNGHSLTDATTAQNWIIKPQLRTVPGVAEVNTWGGLEKQYQVQIDPRRLVKHGLSFAEVFEALERNNRNVGGGLMAYHEGESVLLHGLGRVSSVEEIEDIVIRAEDGVPIRIRDVTIVEVGHEIRRAVVTANGKGETVLGLGFMLMGQNSGAVSAKLEEKLASASQSLPPGMATQVVYDRTDLVEQVLQTVRNNLFEGALLVVAVLFIFLGNLRAGLIVAAAIPLSMLCAFSAMLKVGIAGSLMSLGAIDFGLIVDSSVIMVENSVRRLAENQARRPHLDVVREAALEVRRPTMFGELIILIVYLPILTLEGVEGKLFRPMAITVIFALLGSLVLSLTLMPVLASLLLPRKPADREPWLMGGLKYVYRPILHFALRDSLPVCAGAIGLLALAAWAGTRLGSEFIPRLQEGAIVANTVRLAGVSVEESARYGTQLERVLLQEFPDEIKNIWTRTGTPEIATDPMGLEISDVFITLKPRAKWKRAKSQEDLVILISRALQGMPGMRVAFTQPIEMRVNEMIAGIRTDLGVKIYGDDFETLKALASQVESILKQTAGSADPVTEQLTGQPVLQIRVRPETAARYGMAREEIMRIVECLGGRVIGEIQESQMRFDLAVRLAHGQYGSAEAIRNILIPTSEGQFIPLHRVAEVALIESPTVINREWGRRRVVVSCNVRGRDVGSFVAEVKEKIAQQIRFSPGVSIDYGGQFEHLERGRKRLMIVVPLALGLIVALLYFTFGRALDAALVFTGVPFAVVGGIFALWLRDMPFSLSAGVGFVALSGVSVLGEMVLVSTVRQLLDEGLGLRHAIEEAAMKRLRPVLMTAFVASLGFVPMAFSTGVGAEVQKPLATVVIGGVFSSTALTLIVLPALYSIFAGPAAASGSFTGGGTTPSEPRIGTNKR